MGHAKGILHFTPTGGFWLIHSMPKFADGPDSGFAYNIPNSGRTYGQSYICLSLSLSMIEKAAIQLEYIRPQIYASNYPKQFNYGTTLKYTQTLIASGKSLNTAFWSNPLSNVAQIVTKNGIAFTHLAKNVKWNKDLYSQLVRCSFYVYIFFFFFQTLFYFFY